MTTGQKIYECRKKAGFTQEELAEKLGVSRQAVSKWESDLAFPETEKILELCKLFHVSADELLFGQEGAGETPAQEKAPAEDDGKGTTWGVIKHDNRQFEYISKRRFLGLPLVHIHFGLGVCRAHGVIALGNFASGFLSAGFFSAGFLSFGLFAVGLLALGSFVLGCIAAGSVVAGILAFGGVAVGVLCFGGVAVGNIAIGGLAVGKFAVGDWAYGWCAVGLSHAEGAHVFLVPEQLEQLGTFLTENVSVGLGNLIRTLANGLRA